LASAIASTNPPIGTEPSGRQPPLIRQPTAPFALIFLHVLTKVWGDVAGIIVSKSFPPQWLQFNEQELPVIEIEGKAFREDRKYLFS
jgi:hypothetical protein